MKFRTFALIALLGAGGCDTDEPVAVASVVIEPAPLSLTGVGASASVSAVVSTADGATLNDRPVTWASDNPSVAVVTGTTLSASVTAISVGSTVIRAAAGGITGTLSVTVVGKVRSISVTPPTPTVRAGEFTPLAAAVSADPGTALTVTWSTSSPAIATVSATGVLTGITEGTAAITATSTVDPTIKGTVTALVTAPTIARVAVATSSPTIVTGGTAQASATPFDAAGRALPPRATLWSSSNVLIASVSASGLVTGNRRGGPVYVRATVDGATDSVAVRVVGVVSVAVSPADDTVNVADTQELKATVVADPDVATGVSWTSSDPAVATVSAAGVVTGVSPGRVRITAASVVNPSVRGEAVILVPSPCETAKPIALGTTVTNAIVGTDCLGQADFYEYTVSAPSLILATLSPAFPASIGPIFSTTPFVASVSENGDGKAQALVAPGTYRLRVASTVQNRFGAYTLGLSLLSPADCNVPVVATLDVTALFALGPNCPTFSPDGLFGTYNSVTLIVAVPAGKALNVSAVASRFPARIEAKRANGDIAAVGFAAFDGETAAITYTPQVTETLTIIVTAQTTGAQGLVRVTIDP